MFKIIKCEFSKQDAHEFLCKLLDQLKEDIDKLNNDESQINNPVINSFQFEIKKTIHCKRYIFFRVMLHLIIIVILTN